MKCRKREREGARNCRKVEVRRKGQGSIWDRDEGKGGKGKGNI